MNNYKIFIIILLLLSVISLTVTACNSLSNKPYQPSTGSNSAKTVKLVSVPAVFQGFSTAGMYKSQPTEVELDTELTESPEQLMSYRNITNVTDDAARNIARKLGLSNELPLNGNKRTVYTFTEDNQLLEIHLDGYMRFESKENISGVPQSIPDDQKCIVFAKNWLLSYNLYPPNVTQIKVGYGGISVAAIDSQTGKAGAPVYYSKVVSFIASIGQYEGNTLGAFVSVGDQGKIVRAEIITPEFRNNGLVKIKTSRAALDVLESYLARLTPITEEAPECICNTDGTRVVINKISIQYVKTYKTRYILPIYVFEGNAYIGISPEPKFFRGKVDAVDRQKP